MFVVRKKGRFWSDGSMMWEPLDNATFYDSIAEAQEAQEKIYDFMWYTYGVKTIHLGRIYSVDMTPTGKFLLTKVYIQ